MIGTSIDGREVRIREGSKDLCIVTFFADFDEEHLSELMDSVPDVTMVAIRVNDWNDELSPWDAPPVFGTEGFGDGAKGMLSFIIDELIPEIGCARYVIGGYSLAGLFALWACYESDVFAGCCASSPSVWFPKWDEFVGTNTIKTGKVYLSLGDKEAKTRNQMMSKVADRIEMQSSILSEQLGPDNVVLEWNRGNHFQDPTGRQVRSYEWMLDRL